MNLILSIFKRQVAEAGWFSGEKHSETLWNSWTIKLVVCPQCNASVFVYNFRGFMIFLYDSGFNNKVTFMLMWSNTGRLHWLSMIGLCKHGLHGPKFWANPFSKIDSCPWMLREVQKKTLILHYKDFAPHFSP